MRHLILHAIVIMAALAGPTFARPMDNIAHKKSTVAKPPPITNVLCCGQSTWLRVNQDRIENELRQARYRLVAWLTVSVAMLLGSFYVGWHHLIRGRRGGWLPALALSAVILAMSAATFRNLLTSPDFDPYRGMPGIPGIEASARTARPFIFPQPAPVPSPGTSSSNGTATRPASGQHPPSTQCACREPQTARTVSQPVEVQLRLWANEFRAVLPAFLLSEAIFAAILFITSFLLGSLVLHRGWNPSYTRKLLAIVLLSAPLVAQAILPVPQNPFIIMAGFLFGLLYLAMNAASPRRCSRFLDVGFAAVDRPEDRPHTLAWLLTSYVVSSLFLFAMMWGLPAAQSAFIIVAIVATGLGDTLAGAVGVRYGQHRYRTWALFTRKAYTRSYEGSAAMFLVVALSVVCLGPAFGAAFWPALIILPPVLTLAEAQSPHTWDEPALVAACGIAAVIISKQWPVCPC